ncbi:cupin domain-containing protein [Archangium lipolyticum]|uniref:cupin domain-containing protein n=1 Tax=Archangium lipolyticum TaxID=2970465 RepID=UPI00214A192B|nr:cupin domain-containing protein [Archangium lipolyticum]
MKRGLDWGHFVRHHWEKTPALLSLGEPVAPPDQVFRTVVEASEPFRFGTRFKALPNVKFLAGSAQLRSPGKLLPGDGDRDVDGYVRRVASKVGKRQFQLLVEQPLLLDFALWDRLRVFVRGLLERVGFPVLPIVSDVFLGDFARAPQGLARRPHHSVFTLVLQGRLRVRVWKRLWGESPNEAVDFRRHLSEATTLEAGAGDVLYAPSRSWHLEECRGSCMAVRLWIPVKGSRPADAVKDVLVTLLGQQLPQEGAVPYLEYPWRRRRGGAGASVPSLVRTAEGLEELARGPELLQALRIIWAQRVSACGLEPVPPPHEAPPLEDSTLVRGAPHGRVVRMQDSPGQWIWAVNGHAFPMPGSTEALQVLESLESGDAVRVGELCRVARRAPQRTELRRLLETLHALRALEVVSGVEG